MHLLKLSPVEITSVYSHSVLTSILDTFMFITLNLDTTLNMQNIDLISV